MHTNADVMIPKVGSTVHLRVAYTVRPPGVCSRCVMRSTPLASFAPGAGSLNRCARGQLGSDGVHLEPYVVEQETRHLIHKDREAGLNKVSPLDHLHRSMNEGDGRRRLDGIGPVLAHPFALPSARLDYARRQPGSAGRPLTPSGVETPLLS